MFEARRESGLLGLPRHEPRQGAAGGAVCEHEQPELCWTAGTGGKDASGESGDGGSGGGYGAAVRCSGVEIVADKRPHSQSEVEDVILDALRHGLSRTTQEITSGVRKRLPLTVADLRVAAKRENEAKIDQIIANALQSGRRLCRDGLIERVSKGVFKITSNGQQRLSEHKADLEELSKICDELGLEFGDD